MSDELPPKIESYADVIAAARRGMRLRSIAARAGMRLRDLEARIEADVNFAVAIENAYADYEDEKRSRIDQIEQEAIAEGELSLQYKINREAIKELADRDNSSRATRVVVESGGLFEPEYVEHSEEELAAIRAQTESEAERDE